MVIISSKTVWIDPSIFSDTDQIISYSISFLLAVYQKFNFPPFNSKNLLAFSNILDGDYPPPVQFTFSYPCFHKLVTLAQKTNILDNVFLSEKENKNDYQIREKHVNWIH